MIDFLDTSIILGYANAGLGSANIDKKAHSCLNFINKKGRDFVTCYFVTKRDLVSFKKRFEIILEEVKKPNPDFSKLEKDKLIFKHDILRGEKFLKVKEILIKSGKNPSIFLDKAKDLFNYRIDFFIQKFIAKIVIPLDEIDFELKSSFFTWTQNNSDSNILASGIQFHQREKILLVSLDKTDWTKENLENAVSLNFLLMKKYPKIPEVKYL